MFDTRTRLFFLACLEDAAGAALKKATPAPGPAQKKIGSGSATLKKNQKFPKNPPKNTQKKP